ncbi:hypothetical protein [Bacillus sp. FJAT-29814]|nr:hypothetical protein [Bacillus sp. FJAT-29814]
MKENISVYIESNVIKKVEAYAKTEKRSKSNAIQYLLEMALRNLKEDK